MKLSKKIILAIVVIVSIGLGGLYYINGIQTSGVYDNAVKVKITASKLNFRSGAGTNHQVIGSFNKGDILESLGNVNDWYVVKTANNSVGCISNKYAIPVTTNVEPSPVPQPNPQPTPQPSNNFSVEQIEMLGYINQARAEAGAAPLSLDESLNNGAYLKSKDMAENGYFSHTSPTYGSPFEQMKMLGISYSYAGENIAKHFSVKGSHDAFMNSPGHKANILNKNYKKVGLGFVRHNGYLYVTQWFTN